MWSLCHGTTQTSLFGMSFLGNHAEYIAFLLVPIYFLFQHPLTLVFLKVFSFIVGTYVIYLYAKSKVNPVFGLILMFLFLTYPANIFALLYEFHFESLAVGLLVLLFYFFQSQRFFPFCVVMVLTALIKENMPPIIVAFGIFALFTKREKGKWAWLPIVFGLLVFYLEMFIVTPFFRQGLGSANGYLGMYAEVGSSPGDIIKTFVFNPGKILSIVLQPYNLRFLFDLMGPLMFVPLLSPHILFLMTPVLLQHLLSTASTEQTIYYHYAATLAPFIFLAAIESFHFFRSRLRPYFYPLILVMVVLSFVANVFLYSGKIARKVKHFADRLDPVRWEMIAKIPRDAEVVATLSFLAELSQRPLAHSFLGVVQGAMTFTGRPLELSSAQSYALVDFNDPWVVEQVVASPSQVIPRISDFFLKEKWSVVDAVEDIVLFKRPDGKLNLVETSRQPFLPGEIAARITIEENFQLLKFEIGQNRFGRPSVIPLTFYWKALRNIPDEYKMGLLLKKEEQTLDVRSRTIGYAIYPTNIWQEGEYIKEHFWLDLPDLESGDYSLYVGFFNLHEIRMATIRLPDDSGSGEYDIVKLGDIHVP